MRTDTQENQTAVTSAAPPSSPVAPSTQPYYERQEPGGPNDVRVVEYADAYALRGMPVRCTKCGAKRDWAFINRGRDVWVACRCGNVWYEQEMGRRDIDPLAGRTVAEYPSLQRALESMGFDGTFQGMYVE